MRTYSSAIAVLVVVLSGLFLASGLAKLFLWSASVEFAQSMVGDTLHANFVVFSIALAELVVAFLLLVGATRRLAGAIATLMVAGCSGLAVMQSPQQTMTHCLCYDPFIHLTSGWPLGYVSVVMLLGCAIASISRVKSTVFLRTLHQALRVGIYVILVTNCFLLGILLM